MSLLNSIHDRVSRFVRDEKAFFKNSNIAIKIISVVRGLEILAICASIVFFFALFIAVGADSTEGEGYLFLSFQAMLAGLIFLLIFPWRYITPKPILLILFILVNIGIVVFPFFVELVIGMVQSQKIDPMALWNHILNADLKSTLIYFSITLHPTGLILLHRAFRRYELH